MAFSDTCREAVASSVRLTASALLEGSDCWFIAITLTSSSANSRLCVRRGPTAVLSTGKEACEMGVTFQAGLLEWEKYVGVQQRETHRVTVSTCDSYTCMQQNLLKWDTAKAEAKKQHNDHCCKTSFTSLWWFVIFTSNKCLQSFVFTIQSGQFFS